MIKCRHRCSLLKWYAHFLKLAFEVSLFRESEFIQKCFRLNLLARHIFHHALNSKSYTNYIRWYNGKLVCNARNSIFPEKSDAKYLNWVLDACTHFSNGFSFVILTPCFFVNKLHLLLHLQINLSHSWSSACLASCDYLISSVNWEMHTANATTQQPGFFFESTLEKDNENI